MSAIVGGVPFCKPTSDQPADETYLTQPIAVAAMLIALRRRGWEPPPGPIVDPCACGWGGWSIGAMAAEFWGRESILSDLYPRGDAVSHRDAETADYSGAGLVLSNTHFSGANTVRLRALSQGIPVMLLQTLMWFCDGGRFRGLIGRVRHEKRLAFSILPKDIAQIAASGTTVKQRSDSITGWGLQSDGRHHAWGLYEPGSVATDDWGSTGIWDADAHALAAPWLERARQSDEWRSEVEATIPQLSLGF